MPFSSTIDKTYKLECGTPSGALLRLIGVSLGSVLLYRYTKNPVSFLWPTIYLAAQAVYLIHLRRNLKTPSRHADLVAPALHLIVLASFIWAPVYLMTLKDHTATLVGAGLFGSLLVLLVRRPDSSRTFVTCQAAILSCALTVIAIDAVRAATTPEGAVGIVVVSIGLVFCVWQVWQHARQMTRDTEAATLATAQMQKMSAIGRLAGGVAHDFNNSLVAISGSLELLRICESDAERIDLIENAELAASQATGTVKQLMQYSRQEKTQTDLLSPTAIFDDLMKLVRRLIPASVTCQCHIATTAEVRVSKNQILAALINLCVNAVDAMPRGGAIRIEAFDTRLTSPMTLRHRTPLPAGHYVCMRITDTGTGIDTAIISKVFDPFFTTKPSGLGTGLGLASVAGLMSTFGGGADITSSPRGTAVTLFLPKALS